MDYQIKNNNKRYFLVKVFIILYLHEFEEIDFDEISFILGEKTEVIQSYYQLSISTMEARITGGVI